jgi:multidrug resistance efflux pump
MTLPLMLAALLAFGFPAGLVQEEKGKPKQEQKEAPPKEPKEAPKQEPGKGKAEAPPPAEELHEVQKGNLTPKLEIESVFEPEAPAEIRFHFDAYQGEMTILSVLPHGYVVKKGDVLLALDPKPIEKVVAAAENDLRVSRATLKKAEAEADLGARADALALEESTNALKDAETALKVFDEVDGKHFLQRIDLTVKSYEDYVSDSREELDQLEKMYKSEELTNATAEIVVRRARRALERLKIMTGMIRESARVAREIQFPEQRRQIAFALEKARQTFEALKAAQALGKVQRDAELVKARAAAEQQEEQTGKLRKDLEKFTARAPFDGRVFYGQFQQGQWGTADPMIQQLRPGEKAPPQQILLTVCGPRTAVAADLPEANYLDVRPGQAAVVAPTALPDEKIQGRLRRKGFVARAKGPGPSFELEIELQEQKPEVLPGMKAKVTLTGDELRDVVLVPSNAVSTSGPKQTVTVSKDGKNSPREVTAGKTDGKMTQIKSGLEAGEKIVLPKP